METLHYCETPRKGFPSLRFFDFTHLNCGEYGAMPLFTSTS